MRLTASDLYSYHRPSPCELRVYLRQHDVQEEEPGPYEQVIRRLGLRHEQLHLQTFSSCTDLSAATPIERVELTREAVARKDPVIYQPALVGYTLDSEGTKCEVSGQPDFLIFESDGYVIRDSKISRRISEEDHPEIIRQLQLYSWLFHQMFAVWPIRLEVHNGANAIVPVMDDHGLNALKALNTICLLKQAQSEPYSPVGWAKCGACPFNERCMQLADVALLVGVDQGLARALRSSGTNTVTELLSNYDEARLADFQRPWGTRMQKVGKKAGSILQMARAMTTKQAIVLENPSMPVSPNYAMFDLEGLPPQMDDVEKVYLWGLQVFGDQPGRFMPATGSFGTEGDREAWNKFLDNAAEIFHTYGDLPFVHWHHYERVKLDLYIQRFGDLNGIAARVKTNLLDLLPIAQRCLALPLPSYSLKVVEKFVGFKRSQEKCGGDWAIAKYIEATETQDDFLRQSVMNDILTYNREDLQATWEVFQWLKRIPLGSQSL